MATVTQDGKVIEEETTPAQFWKNAGLKEYDHTIFEGEEVTYKALMKNASFLHASALVYEMKNGETWETKIAREGIDKAAADKKLGEYGIDTIRWFQNNSASTTRTAYQVGKYARDDQKVAMLYMMQAYEHSKMSLPGVGNALVMGALDPLNALAFLTGATTLGGSVAAVQAAKETGKLALRTLLIAGFQAHMTKKGAILLGSSAAEGALAAGIQRDREQAIETQKSEIGDKTIQYKQEYSWGDTGARALGGAVIGTTLNIAGRGIGNTFQWGKFKWDHRNGAITPDITPANTATNTVDAATGTTKDATTPDASKVPGTDIVPGKTRLMPAQDATTWMHTLLKRDPFQKVNEWAAIFTEKNGSKAAVQHVPLHYFFRQFYTPIEKHVDDAINQSGLIDKILDVDKKLVDIRLKMAKTANSTDKAALEKEAEKIILKFAQNKNNKKSFSDIRDAVAPLGREIEAYNTVGYAEPRAGFIDSQKKALIKLANHVERLCDLAQNPQDFLKEYKENRQLFGDQDAISITGAFQHYTALAAETRLRIKTRDHLGWAGDWSKPFARKTSKLGPAYERVITNGEDGILAGGAYGRYQPRIENIRKQERGINYGYYNDRIRTISIENNPDSPDNIENISIILTNFHKLNKDANNQLKLGTEGEFSGYFIDGYKAGREADMLRALDRLVSTQGQDGSIYTVPRKALTAIAESAMRLGWDKDPHFAVYLDAIGDLLKVKQSPEKYAQRYMEKLFEKYTKWHFEGDVAAGKDITGVPGKNYFYKTPRAYITAHTLATLSGRRVVPNLEADGSVNKSNPVKLKWDIWNAPPEETTGVKAIWHNLTARNSLITFAAAPLTVPLRVAYGATTGIIKPVLNHTWKGLALAGLTAAGASGAYEYVTDEEAGFGRWALKAGINTVDTFAGTPLRLALSASEKGFNAQAWIIEQATKGNVSLPRIDLDSWGMNPWDYHLPTAWLDEPFFVSTAQATSLNASFTPAAATNTGATMTNANTGNPPVSSALPAVTTSPEAQAARDNLLSLGQRTSDLYETVVREGWTDANKSNFAALQADYNTHAPAAKNLGAHAEEIASRAGNLLNHSLQSSLANGIPLPPLNTSFRQEEENRQNKTLRSLIPWHNGVITLNDDVHKDGWSEERKKALKNLVEQEGKFAKDVFFLSQLQQQDIHARALSRQNFLSDVQNSNPSLPVSLSGLSKLEAPRDPSALNKANETLPPAFAEAAKERENAEKAAKAEAEKATKNSASKNESADTGKSANTEKADTAPRESRPVSHNTDDGSFFGSIGGHAENLGNSIKKMTKVDGGDEITDAVSATIGMFGAAGEKGAGLVGNTYERLMAKQDRSGRSLIREAGAGILALVGMGSIFGPMLDRLGIGTIPIVGTLAKLATVIVVFMFARKGVDSVLPEVTPYAGQHVLQASAADRARTHLPYLTQEEMNVGNVTYMHNRGGAARTDAPQSSYRGPDAMQSVSAGDVNKTHVSHDAASTGVNMGNVAYLPADLAAARIAARNNGINAEIVDHRAPGSNVIPANFSRPRGPAVDGNLALEPL